jgi:hypothetical protein
MIRLLRGWLLISLCASLVLAAGPDPALTGFPFTNEALRYTIDAPSGVSLGEARATSTRRSAAGGGERWDFQLSLDASLPGFTLTDNYRADSSLDLCAVNFEKAFVHGARKSHEFTYFNSPQGTARRFTDGGGRSDVPVSACAHDALTFLYFARRELGQGRVPPAENVLFGASYRVRLEYKDAQTVKVRDTAAEADRVLVSIKGPVSEFAFEMFFARDAARTPLVVRIPLALGTVSLELVR